jgi:hypothetical protein
MRADADFMVYVAARWPALVREAVLLGCPPEQAADVTADALARCRRGWGRASREEDVDQLVRRELEAAAARRSRTRTRTRTRESGREQAAEGLLVLAPPALEELRAREREANRRTLKQAGFVLVPLLLVAAGLTWWTVRGEDEHGNKGPERLARAALARQENPAPGVVWYADGQLHLDHVVLAVEGLRDMTRLGTGVVYGDGEGRVVYLADDGTRRILGHKDPLVPVAATDENGWAAWVDTSDAPKLVVEEAATGNVVGQLPVDKGTRVVAVDGGTVYFVDAAGAHGLIPGTESLIPVSPADLLDVRSRIRAFQLDASTIQVVQSFFDVEFALPGRGASLSQDGNIVVTRNGDAGEVTLFDTRSGDQLPNGLAEDDSTLAVAAGTRGAITYVVAPNGLSPGRELQLRTCVLTTTIQCRIAAQIPNTGGTPVLAR